MVLFGFPHFNLTTEYRSVNFSTSEEGVTPFVSPPLRPHYRLFTLTFETMRYYLGPDGVGQIDILEDYEHNVQALIQFYKLHGLSDPFCFEHPAHGVLVCRFHEPLKIPQTRNNSPWLKPISVKLEEIPGIGPTYETPSVFVIIRGGIS